MKQRITMFFIAMLSILFFMTSCKSEPVSVTSESEIDLSDFENPDIFILPKDLNDMIGNENLVILDGNKMNLYSKEHIKGAVNIGFHSLSNTEGGPGDLGWGTSLPIKDLKEKLESLGVTNDKTVVLYSDVFKGPGPDGRNVWQLQMAGLDNVKLLYGGLGYWKNLGYEVTDETFEPTKSTGLTLSEYDESYSASKEFVYNNLDKMKIIDVRSKKEFDGSTAAGEARGGHIKGATWLEWKELLNEDATPKSPSEIKEIMASMGVKPQDDFVVY
jgi:thiosulfate/3-mercaptopyruvate sulfurtransferase